MAKDEQSKNTKIETSDSLKSKSKTTTSQKEINTDVTDYSDASYSLDVQGLISDNNDLSGDFLASNLIGVFGAPYQFMSSVDPRIPLDDDTGNLSDYGRKYAEKILGRMPLLFLSPGKPGFLKGFNSANKDNIVENLLGSNISDVNAILDQTGRYYTFTFAYADYFNYVNSMCWVVAKLLNIDEKEVTIGDNTGKLGEFDWGQGVSDDSKKFFSAAESVLFYIDSEKNFTETFTNSTTESQLVQKANGYSEQVKEYAYISGAVTGSGVADSVRSAISGALGSGDGNSIATNIGDAVSTIIEGGKLVFPKLWSDSDYSRSYSVTMKLRSPDHDPVSIYLNILVPWIHLVCLTAPLAAKDNDVNGLKSPFLVKGFYKGFFNCDMGIISSLSATKGKECGWTDDGLPTEMDVSLEIEDLYTNIFLSKISGLPADAVRFVKNTGLMDYLANMAALNLNEPEFSRKIEIVTILEKGAFKNLPNTILRRISQKITNKVASLYSKISF